MQKAPYTESQKMDTIWPLALMALTLAFNWYIYFRQGQSDLDFFYVSTGTVGLICILFMILKLEVSIDNKSIRYKFFPFHLSWQSIEWADITEAEVRKYKPISEYGGWGLRLGWKGKAYTVSGNKGLQLYMKTGKKILFGTSRPEELASYLNTSGLPVKNNS